MRVARDQGGQGEGGTVEGSVKPVAEGTWAWVTHFDNGIVHVEDSSKIPVCFVNSFGTEAPADGPTVSTGACHARAVFT